MHRGVNATLLHAAARNNHTGTISRLIEMGAEVDARNAFNVTPLMVASHRGAIKAAELLVENGADVMFMNDQVRRETVNP
jgi:ankyrin repeat protein